MKAGTFCVLRPHVLIRSGRLGRALRTLLPRRSTLLLVLVASVAVARDREPLVRSVYLSEDPRDEAMRVNVTGQLATVLRFQQPCDPARTKLLGWEGRFEPVECAGKSVLLVPLLDLEPEDRFLLLVTLADGKELPFTVTAVGRTEGEWPDQQVNVFLDPETPDALRKQLEDTRARERMLREATERHWREDTADHALAKLLASGAIKQTPFKPRKKRMFRGDGVETMVRVYSGKTKAAVLFTVTNRDPLKPWSLAEARLVTVRPGEDPEPSYVFGGVKRFALRKDRDAIAPGESGNVAVVVDGSAFHTENGPVELVLELYRQDGWRQAYVVLDARLTRE